MTVLCPFRKQRRPTSALSNQEFEEVFCPCVMEKCRAWHAYRDHKDGGVCELIQKRDRVVVVDGGGGGDGLYPF